MLLNNKNESFCILTWVNFKNIIPYESWKTYNKII